MNYARELSAVQLAEAIKWMLLHNSSIDWGEDIPYLVADILGEDGYELWRDSITKSRGSSGIRFPEERGEN